MSKRFAATGGFLMVVVAFLFGIAIYRAGADETETTGILITGMRICVAAFAFAFEILGPYFLRDYNFHSGPGYPLCILCQALPKS
jgi:hypothetical protein